jgi:predicted metalloendopeptidase
MQNQNIIQLIENLKGRKSYEEKKASKLGFSSLYNYFEDKILKEKQMIEEKKNQLEEIKKNNDLKNKENKSCSCC